MPALNTLHVDGFLTNLSLAYMNPNYVADQIMPPVPVEKRSDKYPVYDISTFLRGSGLDASGRPNSLVRPKGEAVEDDWTLSSQPYYAERYARRELVTDAEIRIADSPIQPEMDATIARTEKLKIDNEMAVANLACTTTNYPAANKVLLTTGASGTSWAQYASANSKPLSDIKNGTVQVRKSIMREANAALYTIDTARTLADHPDIKDLVKYTHQDALTTCGLPKVLRGLTTIEGATQNITSAEGAATTTTGNVWQDQNGTNICLIFYRSMDVAPRSIHFGRTFEAPDDTTGARGFVVERYRWDPKHGWYIEVAFTRDWRLMAIDGSGKAVGGYLLSGATA